MTRVFWAAIVVMVCACSSESEASPEATVQREALDRPGEDAARVRVEVPQPGLSTAKTRASSASSFSMSRTIVIGVRRVLRGARRLAQHVEGKAIAFRRFVLDIGKRIANGLAEHDLAVLGRRRANAGGKDANAEGSR